MYDLNGCYHSIIKPMYVCTKCILYRYSDDGRFHLTCLIRVKILCALYIVYFEASLSDGFPCNCTIIHNMGKR